MTTTFHVTLNVATLAEEQGYLIIIIVFQVRLS